MVNKETPWFSFEWFFPSTWENMSFQHPFWLYGLILIPLFFLFKHFFTLKKGAKLPIAFPNSLQKSDKNAWLRFIPDFLTMLATACLLLALARPQKTNVEVEQWTEGINITLLIDISESMKIQDFEPNRLEAAKDVARNFIEGRKNDRIGLVVFSGDAFSLSPLTTDYNLLFQLIEDIDFDLVQSRGTAIGSAIAVGTNRMREGEEENNDVQASNVMVLLSDGDNTAGNLDPITAAELAHAYNIKIYSIGIGKEGKVPFGKDFYGNTRYLQNNLDESTLKEIAKIGNGEFFRATNKEALKSVFDRIDQYEKAEIKETRFKDTTDFYGPYLKWALLFIGAWMLIKATSISSILTD